MSGTKIEPGIVGPITGTPSAEAEPVIPPPPPISARRRPLSIEIVVIPVESVIISDVAYEMFSLEHFGPSVQQKILIHWNQIQEILTRIYANLENATTDDDAELSLAYDNFFSFIMPKAKSAIDKLYLSQKRRLYDHFLDYHTFVKELLGEITPEEATTLAATISSGSSEDLSTGATTSLDSSVSTGANDPQDGSTTAA